MVTRGLMNRRRSFGSHVKVDDIVDIHVDANASHMVTLTDGLVFAQSIPETPLYYDLGIDF